MLKYIAAYLFILSFHIGYGQPKDTLKEPFEVSLLYDLYLERGLILDNKGLTFTYRDTRFRIWKMRRVSFYNTKFIPRDELDRNVLDSLSAFMDSLDCFNDLKDIPRPETMGRTTLFIKIIGPCLKKPKTIKHGSYYSVFDPVNKVLPFYQKEIDAINALIGYLNALVPDKYGIVIEPPKQVVD